jgi:proteic killer suppression protein
VIKSFRCAETERLHHRERSRRFQAVEQIARRKLRQLDSVTSPRRQAIGWSYYMRTG